jgi:exodeoxyribonuclease III
MEKKNSLSIWSWNIDGLRTEVWPYLFDLLSTLSPDILCLNETKKSESDLKTYFDKLPGYTAIINSHRPCHWHGVAILIKKGIPFKRVGIQLKCELRKDNKGTDAADGRIIAIDVMDKLYVVATYSPNSGTKNLDYRTEIWDNCLFNILEQMRRYQPVVWIGDINVAPQVVDVSNPIAMKEWAGFTEQERNSFARLLNTGEWADIWREQHPKDVSYTWRGRSGWRDNYGMRLDNCIVSKSLVGKVAQSFHLKQCPASTDHIPIGLVVNIA